ncbi:MAG: GAF domain-containing protein [Armatimonadetes bacterium]|nr:GAF domain-containing protein [Armatimonadota bacterium]
MSPWNAQKNQEQDITSAALKELPPEQELEALRARVADLEKRIAEKSVEADALREIGQAIGSMLSMDEILKRVADIVVKVTGTDLCLIYLLEANNKELVLRGASGATKEAVGKVRLKVGEGITGWVAQQGRHVALPREAWRDERFKPVPNLLQDKYQSMLSVPLRGRNDLVGVINVRTNPPHDYTEIQVSLLDSIARQVGGAVENYNEYRRMEQRASQLSTLSEISRTITSDMYLEEILQLIVAMTAESMNFKICSVMLLDENREELVIKATQSRSRAYTKKPNVKLSESVAGRAIIESKPITIRDVRKTPGYQYPDIAKKEGLCSLIALPLSVKKEIIGVLNCYTAHPHEFTDEEISLLTALANQAAISIQNAKLMVRTAVLHEMHHRVKNSLQTIASLLRLQVRMGKFDSPKEALNQSIQRIQSIATVHEMLSSESLDNVSTLKLADQILSATAHGLIPEAQNVTVSVQGDDFPLPSSQATYVALILNELIQNAVEHGLKNHIGTELTVRVSRDEDDITIDVINDGEPLPADFDIKRDRNLGLRIVESLVRDNLMGDYTMTTEDGKTRSRVRFPR